MGHARVCKGVWGRRALSAAPLEGGSTKAGGNAASHIRMGFLTVGVAAPHRHHASSGPPAACMPLCMTGVQSCDRIKSRQLPARWQAYQYQRSCATSASHEASSRTAWGAHTALHLRSANPPWAKTCPQPVKQAHRNGTACKRLEGSAHSAPQAVQSAQTLACRVGCDACMHACASHPLSGLPHVQLARMPAVPASACTPTTLAPHFLAPPYVQLAGRRK